jgi:hypothetical protein
MHRATRCRRAPGIGANEVQEEKIVLVDVQIEPAAVDLLEEADARTGPTLERLQHGKAIEYHVTGLAPSDTKCSRRLVIPNSDLGDETRANDDVGFPKLLVQTRAGADSTGG